MILEKFRKNDTGCYGKVIPYTLYYYFYLTLPIRVFPIAKATEKNDFQIHPLQITLKTPMLIYLPNNRIFKTRKEAKIYLGGITSYNRDIFFINQSNSKLWQRTIQLTPKTME